MVNSVDTTTNASRDENKESHEDRGRKWLAVLIACIALLVSITSWLQTDASNQAAEWSHIQQENATESTGESTRGQLIVSFANSMVRAYDERQEQAVSLQLHDRALEASAFITAAKAIAQQTTLLEPPYATFDSDARRQWTSYGQYEADTWVVTATLYSERSEAASKAGNAWGSKGNTYKASIVVFAVVLFLLALATIVNGFVRWFFVLVGMGLAAITCLEVLFTALVPVAQIPDAAIQQFAQGYGYAWQGKYDAAIQAYDRALAIYPDYANAMARRGQAWFHTQPPEIRYAVQDLEAASQRITDKYSVFWNLGWAYYLVGEYSKSIQASQTALGLNSQVCGPAFNVAIARLTLGKPEQAELDYEAAISRCEKIVQDSLAAGLAPPFTLWDEIEASAEDIENLLCQTHQRYCYPGREQVDVKNIVNRDAVLATGEKYLKRIKETLTALEYMHTATVKPSGARFEPLVFSNESYTDVGDFQAYVIRDRFPNNDTSIYAMWDYADVKPDMETVWKVYVNGTEKPELRYVGNWGLAVAGSAVKKIDSWFVMTPGRYDVEVYGDGELLSSGTFTIDENEALPVQLPGNVLPTAQVNAGALIFYDDFANNNHGWWSSSGSSVKGTAKDSRIENGEYRIVSHKQGYGWSVTCEDCGQFDDLYYEATARYVGGPKDYGYGLVLRGDRGMDQRYLFLIDEKGNYKIAKVVDGTYLSLTDWTQSAFIHPGDSNRLGVLARGSSFEFFVNGQSAARLIDTSLAKGYIGLTVETSELEVSFSQVRAWKVK